MKAVEALALVGGHVNEELLTRNEYLAAENEILKAKINKPIRFNDYERIRLAKIGKRLGLKALKDVATIVKPETIMAWFRKLVAKKFDGTPFRKTHGRPRIDHEIEALVVKIAEENRTWGYDRISGAMANLGYKITDETVGNILRRNGIPPAPRRQPTIPWSEFIRTHQDNLAACDFFTVEVLSAAGLLTYYVLFFIHLGSRRVHIAGLTEHPDEQWMKQIARNITMAGWGFLYKYRYLIHDRDDKFCPAFDHMLRLGGLKIIRLPKKSPDLNAFAERWVRSVKEECLSRLVLFGERGLRRALSEYVRHYHEERNHQGKDNVLLFPRARQEDGRVKCKERLGGLLKFYYRKAA